MKNAYLFRWRNFFKVMRPRGKTAPNRAAGWLLCVAGLCASGPPTLSVSVLGGIDGEQGIDRVNELAEQAILCSSGPPTAGTELQR